ncbi:MAG: Hsp70 family protein [Rickettsiales bacterium]|jgi:molecular chaperone HscA|nr:Hsp70 family protein [Rickettsiales bacterium]
MQLLQIHEPGQTPLPHEDTLAVGIDLGTTHSVVAVSSGDNTEVLHNIHGHALVPSVVFYARDGSVEVGYPAKKRADSGEAGTIASIKRRMHESAVPVQLLHRQVTPVEVSSEILKELKRNAERALGKDVTKAVITVPAYFDDSARQATKDAAKLAGLEVLRLINEPTAAALAYGLDTGAQGIYAVYDLGGGTFDISLLKLEQGVFQVLATGGDTQLGGDDIDNLIPAKAGILSRVIKEKLSEVQEYAGVTRAQLETLARPLIERTLTICARAFDDAKLSKDDVKGIVLVGGSTRMPLVRHMVAEWFGREPLTNVNPDEVVAIGAAIQAHGLTQGSNNLLLDVVPLSLGLETMGGLTEKIIERNTPIPVTAEQEFTTYQDGQTGMQVHVVQGERELVSQNRSLARFELSGIPPLPAGIARVKVRFAVDADGLLTVSAEEKTTGIMQSVQVKPSYGLAEGQIEAMLLESMKNAQKDILERLLIEARVEAERQIVEVVSAMKADGDLLSEPEKKQIERQIQVLKNAISGNDRDYMDVEVQELARVTANFAQRRMDKAIAGALKGTHIENALENKHA